MSLLRTSMFRSQAFRPFVHVSHPTRIQARFATQDYGSSKGDPAGERPQEQGKNPKSHLEHPGPEAPKVGGGKSSSSKTEKSSGGQKQTETSAKDGAKPKILDARTPEKESEETKKHNEEVDKRYDGPVTKLGRS